MKDRNNPAAEYSVALKPASQEEAGLFYSDEKQDEVLGTVGHLRIDFGSGGKSFWSTWWPHNADQLNTPEFKRELQHTVDTLRRDGPLQSLTAMSSYCWKHGGEISKNDRVYGYIAETEHYRFCLRCTPRPGEYQGYLYCYDLRQQRMQLQDHLVGRVTYASGEVQEFTDPQEYLQAIREELPYGKKFCKKSPTIDEEPLQQAILRAVNMVMEDRDTLESRLTNALAAELLPMPGETMSIADIDGSLESLGKEFDSLLSEASAGGTDCIEKFSAISQRMAELKERKKRIEGLYRENDQVRQRINTISVMLRDISEEVTVWDEGTIHQMLDKVTILSGNRIRVTFRGGAEVEQEVDQERRRSA